MNEDELQKSLKHKKLEADADRLIFKASEDSGLQFTELYFFEDDTRSNLIKVEYSWSTSSEDSFQSIVNLLYESVSRRMPIPDERNILTKEMVEMGVTWTASDNSSVRIMSSTEQYTISIHINAPREVRKTLMPSN